MLPSGTPLSEWLAWLETLSPTEINLGLERMQTMLERLQPDRPRHVLLIAGTNGKGSSVAMGDALLRAVGERVGAYTSPHLQRYNERISIEGVAATDSEIVAAFERIEACRAGIPLTYFEFGTLAAVLLFAAAQLDVWILEVGLGGRLDASNAIAPTASLITNIALDHCDWLGEDLEAIATEKAGVMRPGVATVFGDRQMPAAIQREARATGARLVQKGRDFDVSIAVDGTWCWTSGQDRLTGLQAPGLAGEFQIGNAASVLSLLAAAGFEAALNARLINAILPNIALDGRLQTLRCGARIYLFDVAHNPASARVLSSALDETAHSGKTVAIFGVMRDKDVAGILDPLLVQVDRWIAVAAHDQRALPGGELARQVANRSSRPCLLANAIEEALEFARRTSAENDRILVTGSFLTVAPALRALGQIHHPPETE